MLRWSIGVSGMIFYVNHVHVGTSIWTDYCEGVYKHVFISVHENFTKWANTFSMGCLLICSFPVRYKLPSIDFRDWFPIWELLRPSDTLNSPNETRRVVYVSSKNIVKVTYTHIYITYLVLNWQKEISKDI